MMSEHSRRAVKPVKQKGLVSLRANITAEQKQWLKSASKRRSISISKLVRELIDSLPEANE